MEKTSSEIFPLEQGSFQELFELLPFPIAILDTNMCYLAASNAWCDTVVPRASEIIGKIHYDLFPDLNDQWKKIHRRCLRNDTTIGEIEELELLDGTKQLVRWIYRPWHRHDRSVGGICIYSDLVQEREDANKQLAERDEFIEALFEKSQFGMNLCQMDGLWLKSNPAFLDIIGYSHEEADGGLTYWDLTPRKYDEDEAAQLDSLKNSGRYGPYEKEFVRKDGTHVPVRLNGFIMEQGDHEYIWSLIEDITERKQLERTVDEERMKAIQASKLATLGEMAAGIAHEINNPLAILDGYLTHLTSFIDAGDQESIAEAIDRMKSACSRAARIVRGLKKFARDGSREERKLLQLSDIISETLDLCQTRLQIHSIEFSCTGESKSQVQGSELELSQVLLNLIHNAMDAVRPGDERCIALQIFDDPSSEQVYLEVRDSGPGVPETIVDRIFDPFFTTKTVGEGTGLGLSISREIIEDHGGELTYTVEKKQSCFTISLPKA